MPVQASMRRGAQGSRGVQQASGTQNSREGWKPERPPGPWRLGRWGSLQGGLGVCLIVGSTAIGAIATMATASPPGFLLGTFVVIGAVAAALAVRPWAGRVIFPVPVLCYLVAALLTGVIYNHSAYSSKTALAIAAAQWIASGFLAMATATVLAVVLVAVRWYLWRRRDAGRDSGRPVPGTGRDPRPAAGRETFADGTYPGYADPGRTSGGRHQRRPGQRQQERRSLERSGSAGNRNPGPRPPPSRAPARIRALQLFQRGVAKHQVLDAVVGPEVNLGLGLVAVAFRGHHGAEPELVVSHHVPRRQRRHPAVPR